MGPYSVATIPVEGAGHVHFGGSEHPCTKSSPVANGVGCCLAFAV